MLAIGTNRAQEHIEILIRVREERSSSEGAIRALWSLGELAREGNERAVQLLQNEVDNIDEPRVRALCWLGLAKAGAELPRENLEDAMDAATSYPEAVIIGIAGGGWPGTCPSLREAFTLLK